MWPLIPKNSSRKGLSLVPVCLALMCHASWALNSSTKAQQAAGTSKNIRKGAEIAWFGGEGADSFQTGKMVTCNTGSFAVGFQLKIEVAQSGQKADNTGLNGIRLICADAGSPDDEVDTVESLTGPYGQWKREYDCGGLITGFHVRAQYFRIRRPYQVVVNEGTPGAHRETRYYNDYIGAVGMNAVCGNPDKPLLKGDQSEELKEAEYRGAPLRCLRRQAVCGIQTYLGNSVSGDKQGLVRIVMKCCNIEDEAKHCAAKDKWSTVLNCDNTKNTDSASALVCTYKLQTGVETSTSQSSTDYVMNSQKKSVGFSAGFEFAGVMSKFENGLGKSKTTRQEWTRETSNTFSKSTTTEATFSIAPGVASKLEQVVGRCDSFTIRPNSLRKLDNKIGKAKNGPPQDLELNLTVSDYTLEALKQRLRYRNSLKRS